MNSYLTYKYLIEPDKAQRERIDAILKDVNTKLNYKFITF